MSGFNDSFSKHADIYVKYRPQYPADLYEFLSSLTEVHDLAWDCGTGNGQAAIGLAKHFKKVIATDPSDQQINNALKNEKIEYSVQKAEYTNISSGSADLITVANAMHWFDLDKFYAEAKRVSKQNGILAAWSYKLPVITPGIDKIIDNFHYGVIDPYWQAPNRLVEQEYKTIPFPFPQIESPDFCIRKIMTLEDFCSFLNTWSAVQRFIRINGYNPVEQVQQDLVPFWQNGSAKEVTWKLVLKLGRL